MSPAPRTPPVPPSATARARFRSPPRDGQSAPWRSPLPALGRRLDQFRPGGSRLSRFPPVGHDAAPRALRPPYAGAPGFQLDHLGVAGEKFTFGAEVLYVH